MKPRISDEARWAGAVAIATAQLEPNDGTPEEYANAAIDAAAARIVADALHDVVAEILVPLRDRAKAYHYKAAVSKVAVELQARAYALLNPTEESGTGQ